MQPRSRTCLVMLNRIFGIYIFEVCRPPKGVTSHQAARICSGMVLELVAVESPGRRAFCLSVGASSAQYLSARSQLQPQEQSKSYLYALCQV